MITLDKRLRAVASLVRPGVSFCDIGTDHGYLPIFLVQQGVILQAIAADINRKPLLSAKRAIEECHLSDKIETILSDGLSNIPPEKARDIAIAGMGGELIAEIILSWPYSADPMIHYILQPMTRVWFLRKALCENGFSIQKEVPVIDGIYYYTAIFAVYTGDVNTPSDLFLKVGKIPEETSLDALIYLQRELFRTHKIAFGLKKSKEKKEEAQRYFALANQIEDVIKEMKLKCLS